MKNEKFEVKMRSVNSLKKRIEELARKELVLEALEALQKKDLQKARENLLKVLVEWEL